MDLIDEISLLGASILLAQKFEFVLYGIISHLSHLPEAKKEKRFRDLTPEKFLRGDTKYLKATLGQLESVFGYKLLLRSDKLKDYIDDRNLICHSYWRKTRSAIKGTENLADPEAFLRKFINNSDEWISIATGLMCVLMTAAAQKEGRFSEINFSLKQKNDIAAFKAHVSLTLGIEIKNSI